MATLQEYKILKEELRLVADAAPQGSHKKVASAVGISEQYSKDIRDRQGAKLASEENIRLLNEMILLYRKEIQAQIEILKRAI